MLSEQQQRIMGYFIEEAKDHLNTIEQGLVNLQATIEDSEMVHEVFRAAHSVKGGAAMLGLASIQLTAHRLEDYFKVLKECPQVRVDQKLETLFLRVYDTLHELVDQLQGPFGLTDDKAQEAVATVEPVFNELGQHLNGLVSQVGGILPEDVSLTPISSISVAQPVSSPPQPPAIAEESAFQFIFQNDVPARLREMLQLFKQTDCPESRGQLQAICRMLSQPGEQFDLPKWCELLTIAQRAIGNPENTYRTLAPVIIKDVKRAQEFVLSGRSNEIEACSELIQLLPPETEAPEDMEAVEEDNLFDLLSIDSERYTALVDASPEDLAAEANEAALLFGDPSFIEQPDIEQSGIEQSNLEQSNREQSEPIPSTDDWFSDMTVLDHAGGMPESDENDASALEFDLGFDEALSLEMPLGSDLESALEPDTTNDSLDLSFLDQIESNESLPDEIGEHSGPEVGVAELNSLADLFEGELSDLTWQEEEIIEQPAQATPQLFSPENSGDFSDLLFEQDGLDALTLDEPEDDDLSGLLNAATLPVNSGSGIEQPSPLNPDSVSIDGLVASPNDSLSPLNLELPDPFDPSDPNASDDMAMFFFPDPPSEDNSVSNEASSYDEATVEGMPEIETPESGGDNVTSEPVPPEGMSFGGMSFEDALFGGETSENPTSENPTSENPTSENPTSENDAFENVASTSFDNLDELFAGADVGVFASEHSNAFESSESLESDSLDFQSIFATDDDVAANVEEPFSSEMDSDMDLGLLFGETIDEPSDEPSDESGNEASGVFDLSLDNEISNETIETSEAIDPFDAAFLDLTSDTVGFDAIETPDAEANAAKLDDLDISPWEDVSENPASEDNVIAVPAIDARNDEQSMDAFNLDEPNNNIGNQIEQPIDNQINDQIDSQEAADLTFDFPDLNPELDEVDSDVDLNHVDASSTEEIETSLQEDVDIPADLDFSLDLFADEAVSANESSNLDALFEENNIPAAADTPNEFGFDLDDLFGGSESSGDSNAVSSDTVTDGSADLNGLLGETDEENLFPAIDSNPDLNAAFENPEFENPEFENPEFENPEFYLTPSQETEPGQPPSEFEAVLASEVSLDERLEGDALESNEFSGDFISELNDEPESELNHELNHELDYELNHELNSEDETTDETNLDLAELELGLSSEFPDETSAGEAIESGFGVEPFESDLFESNLFESDLFDASALDETTSNEAEFSEPDLGERVPGEPEFAESSEVFPDFSFEDLSASETSISETSTDEEISAEALDILDFDSLVVEDAALTQAEGEDIQANEIDFDWDTSSESQADLSDDLGIDLGVDLGVDLVDSAPEEALLGDVPLAESSLEDEFAGLDDMLGDELAAIEPTPDDGNAFDDLELMLADDIAEPSFEPSFESSFEPATHNAPESEDFSDLEALLGDEFPISSPPVPVSPTPIAQPSISSSRFISQAAPSVPGDDEFGDLEALLQDADQKLGVGSSPVRSSASAAVRRPSRRNVIADQTMRVSVKHLDNLNNLVGEMVVNRNSLEQAQERLRQFLDNLLYQVQQLSDVGQRMRDLYERSLLESSLLSSRRGYQFTGGGSSSSSQATHATGASFDALEMDRFTGFHTLSQEMIELIVRVRESASDIDFVVEESDQITRNFRQITTQLQEGLTRSRMVPFAQTADRLPRGVRDNAIKYGKQAELIIEGRDTLIDKMIVEQLYDPMTHLVNNAIAHGIETPEERIAAGKAPTGRIIIRAFHQGNQTVISVSDDGAGINPEKVRAKALAKGLINAVDAQQMSRLETYDLLFHHGFSTADQVDDLRGRGVGLDVVRNNLSEIRGVITIDSAIGKGTTFTIRLPLTLSISKALCCISNRARIAFPMDGVEDMLDVPKERIQMDEQNRPCIQWRDALLPFQPLAELLRYNRVLGRGSVYGGNQEDDMLSVVVLRSAGNYLALQVDQVLGEQEIVIKQLEGPVPKPIGVAGATVLGDGRIMPIADVLELIDLSQGRIRREANNALWETSGDQVAQDAADAKTEPTVLIVDDSITVRELLSMTFNKVGYRVEQARDGQEAWEKLRSGLPCDLVFCDIEMPRMDGLELLSRLQKDPNLTQIPIAMLTSRGADRHRQMAVQLGAKGYFTKPYLEEVLLDAAQRMLRGEVLVTSNAPSN